MSKKFDTIQFHFENIEACNYATAVAAKLLLEFTDDECGEEIPAKIKNGYVRGGLLNAIVLASNQSEFSLEFLMDEHKRHKGYD